MVDLLESGLPLTQAQLGIWSGQQLNPGSALYNAADAVEIKAGIKEDIFEQAVYTAVKEATALNVVFRNTEHGPRQFSCSIGSPMTRENFSNSEASFEQAMQWMRAQLATTVNLETGPLFFHALIKISKQHFIWYFRIHHIASDGFAFALLSQRVADIYNGLTASGNMPESTGRSFGDYGKVLDEDRRYHQSDKYLNDKNFWRSQLEGMKNPVSLSSSNASMVYSAIRQTEIIDKPLLTALQKQALAFGSNWPAHLLALVSLMVYRHTGVKEIILGMPVMGRMGSPSLRVPAMVMNIIPLRISTAGCLDFTELLIRISDLLHQVRPHQRYRYEHLRRDMNLIGGDKRLYGPVVNIMPFERQLEFSGSPATIHNLSAGPVEDISFGFVLLADGSLRFDLEANPNRYSIDDVKEFQSELMELIHRVPRQPELSLSIDPTAFSWLVGDPVRDMPGSLTELLLRHSRCSPDAIAVVDGSKQLSYTQLFEQAYCWANALKRRGIQRGDLVALMLPRGTQAIIANVGILLLGAAYVFIDPEGPVERNEMILEDAKPTLLILDDEGSFKSNYSGEQICFSQLSDQKIWSSNAFEYLYNDNSLAYLIYTSGSTGKPKGVKIGRRAMLEFIAGAIQAYGINASDHILQFAPLHFDTCIEEIFVSLCTGATLHIRSEAMISSIPAFLQACELSKITVLDLPTAYWHELVYFCAATSAVIPDCIRTVIIGGEAAHDERVQQWHQLVSERVRLLNTYGPSEAAVVASCATLKRGDVLSIGKPLPERCIAIVDNDRRLLRKGEPGELLILGVGLAEGYQNLPELTEERFIKLNISWMELPVRAYCSGDLARINNENQIEYIGRVDDEVKISGCRINPLEIESAILRLKNIQEAVVLVNNLGGHKHLVACIVSATPVEIQSLREQLSASLPKAMLPSTLYIVDSLPKNPAGKIDRYALMQKVQSGKTVFQAGNETERLIIQVWQQVLGQMVVNPADDFFMLGGHSLQTIQVANRLSAALKRNIPTTLLFQNPTVEKLAAVIDNETHGTSIQDIYNNILSDCNLPDDIFPPVNNAEMKINARRYKTLLLTGATGFVGVQLLHQLQKYSDARIVCLVRAASIEQACQRLEKALHAQGLPDAGLSSRVEVILADLEKPQLGLASSVFHDLSQRIDLVLHNAALTSVLRDYQSLMATNVYATRELLRLAVQKAVPFHHISTIAVAPEVLEEDFTDWHAGLQDGYQQSKWAAERLLQQAALRGYPVSIYRLARVIGDKQSAFINNKDLVWNIIRASVSAGFYPMLDISEPWTPVDIVAKAVVSMALNTSLSQHVFNLTPDTSVHLPELFNWICDYGFHLKPLPLVEWCSRLALSTNPEDLTLLSFFQQRQHFNKLKTPHIDNVQFKQQLQRYNISFPEVDKDMFYGYLQQAINSGLLPSLPGTVRQQYASALTNNLN